MAVDTSQEDDEFGLRIKEAMDGFSEFRQRLVALREAKKLSSRRVADILGMKPQNYSRFEKGGQNLTLEQIIILGCLYKVSLDYILTGREHKKEKNAEYDELLGKYIKLLEESHPLYKKKS